MTWCTRNHTAQGNHGGFVACDVCVFMCAMCVCLCVYTQDQSADLNNVASMYNVYIYIYIYMHVCIYTKNQTT